VILPTIVVLFVAAIASLYWYLRTHRTRNLFRTALVLGVTIGVIRAVLASVGWYVVEHTGGPLQVPGFALAMLAWPEAVLFRARRTTPVPIHFYLLLSLLLITSTVALVASIAAVASRSRVPGRQVDQ
jgi:hypothetical protein